MHVNLIRTNCMMDIPEHGKNNEYKKSVSLNLFHFLKLGLC
jgi:hypothetical protein